MILPMAGHKGYAITFLMDVLSGALTGSAVGTGVHGPYEADRPSGAGHLFLALDPEAFGDRAGYEARVQQLIDEVKDVPWPRGSTRSSTPARSRTAPRRRTSPPAASPSPSSP